MIPTKPYCTDILGQRLLIRSRKAALRRRHIQVNGPARCQFLVFDVDRSDARFAVYEAGLPQPCWTAISENGTAHIAYMLQTPVFLWGRRKPLQYLADVENGVRRALRGDIAYPGFITRNPLHPDFETVATGYALELGDLAAEVDMSAPPAPEPVSGIGRNCETFTACRKHAYRASVKYLAQADADFDGWLASCAHWAATWTQEHHELPLGAVEAACIGRSVARWTWRRFSAESFSALQAARGRKGGLKGGLKGGRKSRGGGRPGLGEPWIAEGISRRTWFRRRGAGGGTKQKPYQDNSP